MPNCLHILKNAQPECTGVARIVAGLAKHGGSRGYTISVLFLGDGPLVAAMRREGIPAAAVAWSGNRGDVAGAWRVWRWMRSHRAEIGHLHHGGLTHRSLCRLAGMQAVVQHVHGEVLEPDLGPMSQLSFRGADLVIACSEAAASALRGCRPEVVYAGIEVGVDAPAEPAPGGPLRLGVLSRLVPLKKIEAVIEATARLGEMGIDVETEIAGTGPAQAELEALAEELGAGGRVRFLGWREDFAALLSSWHVLVMPSMHEGFPVAALEAMGAGRAVFASRVGGLRELVADGVTGRLFAAGDTESLIRLLTEAEKDRAGLARMGREGWERARRLFSSERSAERMADLYDRLLQRTAIN
jgi:glycosyltransferase involved in cell wall biosynthesis